MLWYSFDNLFTNILTKRLKRFHLSARNDRNDRLFEIEDSLLLDAWSIFFFVEHGLAERVRQFDQSAQRRVDKTGGKRFISRQHFSQNDTRSSKFCRDVHLWPQLAFRFDLKQKRPLNLEFHFLSDPARAASCRVNVVLSAAAVRLCVENIETTIRNST